MAFDGNGAFVRLYNWVQDRINGIKIRADRMDAEMDGMATGLSNTITRDGQSTTTAQIDFAQGIGTDTVSEESAGAGVTVDGVLMKDGRVDWTQASNVASATTTSIGDIDGNYVVITGTTTITGFGTADAGVTRIVRFSGALTLTHNGTSLILATGANRTTAAGDVGIFISEGSGNWREVLYSPVGGVPGLTQSNVFTANQTISSTDAGAGSGPFIIAHRDSASPAANDLLGGLQIDGEDDAGNQETYADLLAEILDPGSGSEDARMWLRTKVAGTLANRLGIGQGIWTPNATGGDQGADTFNATDYLINGASLPFQQNASTPVQTASSDAAIDFDLDADGDTFLLLCQTITPATDNTALQMRVDVGSGFASGGTDYRASGIFPNAGSASGSVDTSQSFITISGNQDTGAAPNIFAHVWIHPGGTGEYFMTNSLAAYRDNSAAFRHLTYGGAYTGATGRADSIRLFMSSGNISSGTFRLLKVKT